jgi:hypothetical protein
MQPPGDTEPREHAQPPLSTSSLSHFFSFSPEKPPGTLPKAARRPSPAPARPLPARAAATARPQRPDCTIVSPFSKICGELLKVAGAHARIGGVAYDPNSYP